MRRAVPWLATGLVGVVAAAAVLGTQGLSGRSPRAWVDRLLARTEAARSAHVSVAPSITGLDGRRTRTGRFTDEVDFATGTFRRTAPGSSARYREVSVQIGDRYYARTVSGWVVYSLFPQRGATTLDAVLGGLASLATPERVRGVRWLGVGRVDGAPATEHGVASRPMCGTGVGAITGVAVWVNGSGRLVEGTATIHVAPAVTPQADSNGAPARIRPLTETETIRFSDFGAPVRIVPPRHVPRATVTNGSLNVFYPCEP